MSEDARRRLELLLDREIEVADRLAAAMLAERAALTGNCPAAVEQTAAEKVRLLAMLDKLEVERAAIGGGIQANLEAVASAIGSRWRALLTLLAGCRTANEVNGYIIHVRQNQIRQLLDIVRGGPAMTYGPLGKTFANAPRALARA